MGLHGVLRKLFARSGPSEPGHFTSMLPHALVGPQARSATSPRSARPTGAQLAAHGDSQHILGLWAQVARSPVGPQRRVLADEAAA